MVSNTLGNKPDFILGFKIKGFLKTLAWFSVSLVGFIAFIRLSYLYPIPHNQSVTNNFFDMGIYSGLNMTGLVSIGAFLFDLSMVFSALMLILTGILFFHTGQLDLYGDYVIWKRPGKTTQLSYDQLEDVYLGYQATPVSPNNPSYNAMGPNNLPVFNEVASFYIGNRKFNFNINRKPDVAKFLEAKIPKKNIDVDDVGAGSEEPQDTGAG